jgi:hypothetical protein
MPWRFSFRALMIAITLLMIGFAAMVSPWPIVAHAAAFVGQLLLAVAVICALVLPRETKPFWIGYAVIGIWYWSSLSTVDVAQDFNNGSSMAVWQRTRLLGLSGSWQADSGSIRQQLPTTAALDWLQFNMHRRLAVGSAVSAQYANGGYYPGVIDDAENGLYLVRWTDGSSSPAQWTPPAQIAQYGGNQNFRLVGHTIFCGLFGILGGALAVWIATCRKESSEASDTR